jgi:hypothetical protein
MHFVQREISPNWLSARVLRAYWYERTTLVFELDVDDIDGWEIPLLVCVAGPRYQPATVEYGDTGVADCGGGGALGQLGVETWHELL